MKIDFKNHIKNTFPDLNCRKVLVTCSGGVDSVVLAHLIKDYCQEIGIAHCNFKLRAEESDEDEKFVHKLAHKLSSSFYAKDFDTEEYAKEKQISVQMAARELRYDWFYGIAIKYNYDYIATAHHLDDNLETFIINLSRGTGIEGLSGIPEINGKLIRPLLAFSKEAIRAFANENKWNWREDSSNQSNKYLRNKIRHEVVPSLKDIGPSFLSNFNTTLSNLKSAERFIKDQVDFLKRYLFEENYTSGVKISIAKLENISNPKDSLFYLLRDYGFTAWDDINTILSSQSGKQIVSATHRIIKDRDYLILDKISVQDVEPHTIYQISSEEELVMIPSGRLKFEEVKEIDHKTTDYLYIDKKKLKYPLIVRKWQQGDYFYPLGMRGKKKLSKYFKDEKFSILDKEKVWLLCSAENVVWIIGYRPDDRFKVEKNTEEILKVTFIK